MNTINFTHATMNRDTHLPSPEVVDWLLDQKWSDVIPVTAITYPSGNPDGVTESERFFYCSATVAIGADECCHLQLPVEALEALRSDQARRVAIRPAPPAPAEGEVGELVAWMKQQVTVHEVARTQWAKRFVRAAVLLEQLSAAALAVVPIPVSERLPGPSDCDAEHYCWRWNTIGRLWARQPLARSWYEFESHWLPAHALPLPSGEAEG